MGRSTRNSNNPAKGNRKKLIFLFIALGIVLGLLFSMNTKKVETIGYSEALNKIQDEEEVDLVKLDVSSKCISLYSKGEKICVSSIPDIQVFTEFMQKETKIQYEIEEKTSFIKILPSLISIGFYIFMITCVFSLIKRLGNSIKGTFNGDGENIQEGLTEMLTGEKSTIDPVDTSEVSFDDVAGIDNERAEVEEVVSMLKNPEKYCEIGAKVPKGVLMVGEPGTGKTLIAKAIAREAGVKFFACSGSNFENVYVGLGASKVRKLFDTAKKNAPAIIFIDEIDSVAKRRYNGDSSNEQTLNQLLSEMDGFDEKSNVIFIAATNHLEVLDPAITRPGRFDRIINIPLPDKKGRKDILEVHARNKKFLDNKEELLTELAKKTAGMSGASLENILNEAAIIAVKNQRDYISKPDIDEAFIKVILGIPSQKGKELSKSEKLLTAVHEAGHAVTSRVCRRQVEILEASIIPRGKAGGYTLFADKEDHLPTKEDLYNDIVVSLGGRAAEITYNGTMSIGASSDLNFATNIAHKMIYHYAMGENTQLVRLYGESDFNSKLEKEMFSSVEKIIEDATKNALEIIKNNKHCVMKLAQKLTEKSTLDSSELEEIFTQFNI